MIIQTKKKMMKMELTAEATITQIIEIEDKETGQKQYLVDNDDEWVTITETEYKELIGDNDGE